MHSYSGDGSEKNVHLEVVVAANYWDPDLMKVMLMIALTGRALRLMQNIPSLDLVTLDDVLDIL